MIVQSPLLGKVGRFANWLIQYQWSLAYATQCCASLETPEWIGEKLFDIQHERIKAPVKVSDPHLVPFFATNTIALPMFFSMPGPLVSRMISCGTLRRFKWRKEYDPENVPSKVCVVHIRRGDFMNPGEDWPKLEERDIMQAVRDVGVDPSQCTIVSDWIPSANNVYPKELDFLYDFQLIMRARFAFSYPVSTFSMVAGRMGSCILFEPHNYNTGDKTVQFKPHTPCHCPTPF